MLFAFKVSTCQGFVLAPSLRWAQEFCDRQLQLAGDRAGQVPSVRLVRLTDAEIRPLRDRTVAKEWGLLQAADFSPDLQRAIRLSARRHIPEAVPVRPVQIKRAAKWLRPPTAPPKRADPWSL